MILRSGTVHTLDVADLPPDLASTVEQVLVIGDLPCAAIATRRAGPMLLAAGAGPGSALRRLYARLRVSDAGAGRPDPPPRPRVA